MANKGVHTWYRCICIGAKVAVLAEVLQLGVLARKNRVPDSENRFIEYRFSTVNCWVLFWQYVEHEQTVELVLLGEKYVHSFST